VGGQELAGGRCSCQALGSQAGLKNAYESIKAFSETDFTEDLNKVRCPDPGDAR
jgi:non-heme chloroperoxidase